MAQARFSCQYDITGIKELGYVECIDILEDNDKNTKGLEELEELQDLIIKLIKQSQDIEVGRPTSGETRDGSQTTFTLSADVMNQIISRDREIKQKLNGIYDNLRSFFKMKEFTSDPKLKEELEIEFKNVQEMVEENSKELMCDESRPIVVAGETSAGKSSLLNLIIGSNILPSSLRSNTSTICRLHNQERKMIRVYDQTGDKTVHSEEFDDNIEDDILKKMQKYISCDKNPYRCVDIFWPIPFLGDQVIIVDTPGVGENREMTSRLLDYLPKAVAFIYVINSENAGGVQQDRLLQILEKQNEWRKNEQKQAFDHKCTLFVCNKWDEVPELERDRVWSNTKEKLRCWPGFTESHMFKLSTLEAERRYRNGLDYSEDFKNLLRGIQKMVPASFHEKVRHHAWWQEKLLQKILFHVTARINSTLLSQEETREKKEKVEERLRKLEDDTEQVKKTLKDEAERKLAKLSAKLHVHLHDQETVRKLKDWNSHTDLPERKSDFGLIEREAKEKIIAKIGKEIKSWCENERLSNMTNDLTNRFKEEYRLLEDQCYDIDDLVQGIQDFTELKDVDVVVTEPSHRIPLFARKEKVAFVLTAPLWVPLMVVALPVIGVLETKDIFNDKQKCKKYIKNKKAYMDKWADDILSGFSKEAIAGKLEMAYLDNFHKCLEQLCDVVIPRQIESDRQMIDNIQQEERRSSAIRQQYHPLEKQCQFMTGKLLLVQMEYFNEDSIVNKNITKGEYLGKGSFANVYKAEIVIGDERRPAAIKCMTQPLEESDNWFSHLTEVSTLLKLSHGWIVKLFGISYEEVGSQKFLQIVMELCDSTLSSRIFPGNDGSPAPVASCSQFLLTCDEMKPSMEFFKSVSMGVCKGLVYIHKKNFIHRDLKPSNILLRGNRAKIADVGLTKETGLITGTLTGTPCYIAPEVMLMKLYGTEVDIYSLGIILWELWYGARAYEREGITGLQIFEQVKAGFRPGFNHSQAPPPSLQKLMKQCWHKDIRCRPPAGNALDIIKEQSL